jgi:hypothetical protein
MSVTQGNGRAALAAAIAATPKRTIATSPVLIGGCPWCGNPVPPKTRGEDRRFCSSACRDRWHTACRKVGDFVLTSMRQNSMPGLSAAAVGEAGIILPPALRSVPIPPPQRELLL